MERVSPGGAWKQKVSLLTVQSNKVNATLWGKGWTCLLPNIRHLRSLSSSVFFRPTLHYPKEMGLETGVNADTLMTVIAVINELPIVSEPRILCSPPASVNLWQTDSWPRKQGKISDSTQSSIGLYLMILQSSPHPIKKILITEQGLHKNSHDTKRNNQFSTFRFGSHTLAEG